MVGEYLGFGGVCEYSKTSLEEIVHGSSDYGYTTVGFEAEISSPFDQNQFLGNLFIKMPLTEAVNILTSVSFDDNRVANRAGLGFGLGLNFQLDRFTVGGGLLNRFRASW